MLKFVATVIVAALGMAGLLYVLCAFIHADLYFMRGLMTEWSKGDRALVLYMGVFVPIILGLAVAKILDSHSKD